MKNKFHQSNTTIAASVPLPSLRPGFAKATPGLGTCVLRSSKSVAGEGLGVGQDVGRLSLTVSIAKISKLRNPPLTPPARAGGEFPDHYSITAK